MRNEIILKSVQIVQNENSEINTEEPNIMTVCDNIIIFESRKNRNDQYETSTEEEVKISKACKNERYWLYDCKNSSLKEKTYNTSVRIFTPKYSKGNM